MYRSNQMNTITDAFLVVHANRRGNEMVHSREFSVDVRNDRIGKGFLLPFLNQERQRNAFLFIDSVSSIAVSTVHTKKYPKIMCVQFQLQFRLFLLLSVHVEACVAIRNNVIQLFFQFTHGLLTHFFLSTILSNYRERTRDSRSPRRDPAKRPSTPFSRKNGTSSSLPPSLPKRIAERP